MEDGYRRLVELPTDAIRRRVLDEKNTDALWEIEDDMKLFVIVKSIIEDEDVHIILQRDEKLYRRVVDAIQKSRNADFDNFQKRKEIGHSWDEVMNHADEACGQLIKDGYSYQDIYHIGARLMLTGNQGLTRVGDDILRGEK